MRERGAEGGSQGEHKGAAPMTVDPSLWSHDTASKSREAWEVKGVGGGSYL